MVVVLVTVVVAIAVQGLAAVLLVAVAVAVLVAEVGSVVSTAVPGFPDSRVTDLRLARVEVGG